jgi:hypothetical protein
MLVTLAKATEIGNFVYNAPAETWEARQLKDIVGELKNINVHLGPGPTHAGPTVRWPSLCSRIWIPASRPTGPTFTLRIEELFD